MSTESETPKVNQGPGQNPGSTWRWDTSILVSTQKQINQLMERRGGRKPETLIDFSSCFATCNEPDSSPYHCNVFIWWSQIALLKII